MRHINLLPWREERRRLLQRRFYHYTLGVAGAAILLLAVVVLNIQASINSQNQRNAYLRQQIQAIDARIGNVDGSSDVRKRMNQRLVMVKSLERTRMDLVHIFDALPRTVPAGVELEELKQNGDALEIRGIGTSNAEISRFIRNLNASDWFHSAELSVVNAGNQGGESDSHFVLEVGTGTVGPEQ